jgi:hypothetical protein
MSIVPGGSLARSSLFLLDTGQAAEAEAILADRPASKASLDGMALDCGLGLCSGSVHAHAVVT